MLNLNVGSVNHHTFNKKVIRLCFYFVTGHTGPPSTPTPESHLQLPVRGRVLDPAPDHKGSAHQIHSLPLTRDLWLPC